MSNTIPDAGADGGRGLGPRPPSDDPQTICNWLQERYMTGPRDEEFVARSAAILRVDEAGECLPLPARFGLTRETRGLLVTGESGAGKSVMIQRNLARLSKLSPDPRGLRREILHVTVPADATLKSLTVRICQESGYPQMSKSMTKWACWDLVRHRLRTCGVALIWIDEAHHLMRRGSAAELSDVLPTLKTLLQGESAVALIVSGVPRLGELVESDPETSRRFVRMKLGAMAGQDGRAQMDRYVRSYCKAARLRAVEGQDLVKRLFFATGGSMGRSIELVLAAIRRALYARRDAVELRDFATALETQGTDAEWNPFIIEDWKAAPSRMRKGGAA